MTTPRPGARIGRHVVVQCHGPTRVAAWDTDLERAVELWLLPRPCDTTAAWPRRLAALEHPHIAAVYDVGTWEGRDYVTTQRVEGRALRAWAQTATGRELLAVLAEIAEALAALHEARVCHGALDGDAIVIDGNAEPIVTGFVFDRDPTSVTPADDQRQLCTLALSLLGARTQRSVPVGGSRIAEALRRGASEDPEAQWPSLRQLAAVLRRGLRRRHKATTLAAAGVLVTAGVIAYARYEPHDPCAQRRRSIAAAWNDPRAAAIADAFASTELPLSTEAAARIERFMDDYGARWSAAAHAVCTGSSAPETLARQGMCLDRRLAEAEALLAVFESPSADVVRHATDATARLPSPGACLDPDAPPEEPVPPDPEIAAAVEAIEDQLRRAHALLLAREVAPALALLGATRVQAEQLGYAPALSNVMSRTGNAYKIAGRYDEALRELEAAVWLALQHDRAAVAAQSAIAAVSVLATSDPGAPAAEFWDALAMATIDRARLGPAVEASRFNALGKLQLQRRNLAAARDAYRREVELAREHSGEGSLDEAAALHNLGLVQYVGGETDDARALMHRALPVLQAHHGHDHPSVATTLNTLGLIRLRLGEFDQAREQLLESYWIRRRVLGPEHPETEASTTGLGNAAMALRDYARAEEWFAESHRIATARLHADHPVIGMALANQARAARQGGAAVRAIELHTRAVETFERGAPWDPTRAAVLEELARAYADAGQLEAAIANAGRAIALTRELNPGDDPMLARRLRARAEIELAAAQRDEAVVDLRAAQDLLRDTGSRFAEDRAEIRALLEGASQ